MSAEREAALLNKMDDLRKSSAVSAGDLVSRVFRDGVVSRSEAETLFSLNDRLKRRSEQWDKRFILAICDFLLETEAPAGWVSDEEADWLLERLGGTQNAPRAVDIDLLVSLLRKAEGAPPRLGVFALTLACQRIQNAGLADEAETERVRGALYAPGGAGGLWVTRDEARLLFETNDAIAQARNDVAWNDLFARAIGNHLLAAAHPDPDTIGEALRREIWLKSSSGGVFEAFADVFRVGDWFSRVTSSPKLAADARHLAREAADRAAAGVNAEEQGWFLKRLGWDNQISRAEESLMAFLSKEAPGFSVGLGALALRNEGEPMDKAEPAI